MTGSRGPISKPDDRRQRRNKPTSPLVVGDISRVPKPRDIWLSEIKENWGNYWKSDLAKTVRVAQIPIVQRLFDRYDERERAYRVITGKTADGGRLVMGSKGQPVLNPLYRVVDACDAVIQNLEDRLGLSPRAIAALGSAFANAQKSLDDLNNALDSDDEPASTKGNDDDIDPRIALSR